MTSVRLLAFAFVAALLATGCGGDGKQWPKRYPTSGTVLVDGRPAVRAVVTFHPSAPHADGSTFAPSTFTDDAGAFKLTTVEAGDGAPAGEYTVTVVANWVVKNGEDVSVPDLLRGRYADPKTSPLKATVMESDNAFPPFELTSAPKK